MSVAAPARVPVDAELHAKLLAFYEQVFAAETFCDARPYNEPGLPCAADIYVIFLGGPSECADWMLDRLAQSQRFRFDCPSSHRCPPVLRESGSVVG